MTSRSLFVFLLGLLTVGSLHTACSRSAVPLVEVAEVRRSPLRVVVTTNGKIEPIDDAEVRARLAGRVLEIPEPGTAVVKGEPVLRIDSSEVGADLATAESDRLSAKESLRAGRDDLARLRQRFAADRDLFAQGAITRERFRESEAVHRDAQARVASLEREVPLRVDALDLRIRALREQLAAAETLAPISGTIYRTDAKKGQLVRAGDLLLAVADLGRLRVRANVDQVDLGRVRADARVRVTSNAHPGRLWTGRMSEVVPHVIVKESRAVSESLAILDPPTEGLVPGMTVDVEIIVAERDDVVQVPVDAVVGRDGSALVYKLDGSRVRATPVKVGLSGVTAAEIVEGLSPGDLVVVGGAQGLEDGERVDPRRSDAGAS